MGSYYCKMYIDGRLHRKFGGTKAKLVSVAKKFGLQSLATFNYNANRFKI